MRALVWFRSDLRADDNRALAAACAAADRGVVGLFLATPEQWVRHDWGAPKAGFVLRGAAALSGSLEKLNIPLVVRVVPTFDRAARAVKEVCRELECDGVYWNREYEINEVRRDEAVAADLERAGVAVRQFDDQVLLQPGTVRTQEGRFYTVFTPFKRAALRLLKERGVQEAGKTRRQAAMVCDPSRVPSLAAMRAFSGESHADAWPASEAEAKRRLGRFVEKGLRRYATDRDLLAVNGTSTLSPYLSAGMISPRQCLIEAMGANGGRLEEGREGPTAWVGELLWREFYRHLLVGFPRLSMGRAFKPATERIDWSDNEGHLQAWKDGLTGVPLVDAGMRQLAATGWMHNRARMVTAMYLTKDLFVSWREGERHFIQHLVDADLGNNNGGWQWAASTGTDSAPYFRIFNPENQAKRYDPEGVYIRRWMPELCEVPVSKLHAMSRMPPAARRALGYPEALIKHDEARIRVIGAFGRLRE